MKEKFDSIANFHVMVAICTAGCSKKFMNTLLTQFINNIIKQCWHSTAIGLLKFKMIIIYFWRYKRPMHMQPTINYNIIARSPTNTINNFDLNQLPLLCME